MRLLLNSLFLNWMVILMNVIKNNFFKQKWNNHTKKEKTKNNTRYRIIIVNLF